MDFDALDHMGQDSLLEVVTSNWWGRSFSESELRLIEAMMVASFTHTAEGGAPSIKAARDLSLLSKDLPSVISGSVLTFGPVHGGAVEHCAKLLQEKLEQSIPAVVADFVNNNKRIPGLGHRVYKESDPRSEKLFELARADNLAGKYTQFLTDLQKEFKKQKGKQLAINIDGAIAALLSDLEIPWNKTNGVFMWPRVAGIISEAFTSE